MGHISMIWIRKKWKLPQAVGCHISMIFIILTKNWLDGVRDCHKGIDIVSQNIWAYEERFALEPFSINTRLLLL